MHDITFISYEALPAGDPDDLLALEILERQGLRCQVCDWRKPFDYRQTRLAVVRSTWDYHLYIDEFRQYIDAVSLQTKLLNSKELLHSNLDKSYLLKLKALGLNTVPTAFVEQGAPISSETLAHLTSDFAAEDLIVKPSVGLATFGVRKFSSTESCFSALEIVDYINELAQTSAVLLQPYLRDVEEYGERSLVFIDGEFSHAVRKAPFQKLAVAGHAGEEAKSATEAERKFGEQVIASLPETPLYARVDVVSSAGSENLRLLELELVEPSLFLGLAAGSAEKFARAIAGRLDPKSTPMD